MNRNDLYSLLAAAALCPAAHAGLFSTPVDNEGFESPAAPGGFNTNVDLWAEEESAFVQSETSGNMILTPYGTQWGGLSGGTNRGAIYQQVGTFDENTSYTVSFLIGDRPNKVYPGLEVQLWAGGTALGDINDASGLNGLTLASQGAVMISSKTTDIPPLSGSVEQAFVFDTGPSTVDYTAGDALWLRFVTVDTGDRQALIDNVSIEPFAAEPIFSVSDVAPIKMFERSQETISFMISNVGVGNGLSIENPVFGDPRFSLVTPTLPTIIPAGGSVEFVVEADMLAVSGAQVIQDTLTLTTNDGTSASQVIDLEVQILADGKRVLIDFDDGIPANGVHEASIRNGGFEDGTAGDDFATTPNWFALQAEGDAVQMTYDTDPATGSLRGITSGFSGGATRSQAAQLIELDDWTLEEGDFFQIEVTWKNGPGFIQGLDQLQVILQVVNEAGGGVGDAANAESPNANRYMMRTFDLDAVDTYQTEVITSNTIQPGSAWIGNRPRLWILVSGPADVYAQIDNVSLVGNLSEEPLNLSAYDYDEVTNEVTLRWNDIGRIYKIQGTGDLDFSGGVSEITLDGSEDRVTYPGEIEFKFIDPAATGTEYFWRVATD